MPLTELSFEFEDAISTLTSAKAGMTSDQKAAVDVVIGAAQQADGLTDIVAAADLGDAFEGAVATLASAEMSAPARSALDRVVSVAQEARNIGPQTKLVM